MSEPQPSDFDSVKEYLEYMAVNFEDIERTFPMAWYNKDGDMFHVHFEDVDYYGDYAGNVITYYRAQDDDRIVGISLKNVNALINNTELKHRMD